MSRLDYSNGLLYGTPAVHLGKLQRLQNAAARLVCTVSRYDHTIPDQPALASGYPQNRIQDSNASSQTYLRCRSAVSFRLDKNQIILLMDNTYRTKKTLGDRAFENVAPKV